jgi:hypothetical protein
VAPKLERFGDAAPEAPVPALQAGPWQISTRERDQKVWSSSTVRRDPVTGRETRRVLEFVELGSGLNYRDAKGEWQPTREAFQRAADGGFVAEFGPHRLALANNINSQTAVDFIAGDGVRLRNGPLAVGFYDPVDGRNVILGTIRDTVAELTAPNEVTYRSAFDGIDASIRITYRRAGMSADLILNEAPPDPATLGLSDLARLELYTEFDPATPMPQQISRKLWEETDPVVRQQMVEPDFTDSLLDFGEYKMPTGTAFEMKDAADAPRVPVAKRFSVIEGRPVLIEAVEWQAAKSLMAALPRAANAGHAVQQAVAQLQRRAGVPPAPPAQRAGVRPSSGAETGERLMAQNQFGADGRTGVAAAEASRGPADGPAGRLPYAVARQLPPRPATGKAPPVQEARAVPSRFLGSAGLRPGVSGHAFVLDYSLVTGATNMTFASDKTYFVKSDVHLYGHTVFENAVIKYTNYPNTAALRIKGTVEFKTTEYTPLILTSQHDNSAGESLPWSTGNPWTNYCGLPALEIDSYTSGQPGSIKHVRVSHAYTAFSFYTGTGHEVKHAQVVHCANAFVPYYADARLRNVLVHLADRVVSGSGAASATLRFEHLTANSVNYLNWNSSSTTYLTNSLFVAVDNPGSYSGANNASNTTSSTAFTTVGAGAHYLAGTTYRGLGTTNLNTNLLAEIRSRTTQPPLTITNGFLAADTTLNPRSSLRYTNNAVPDLGFHYPILDHVLGFVAATNVQLTVNPGAAVGLAIAEPGNYALLLADGAKLLVEGSPTNLARLIRPHLVQEQANNAWKNHGFSFVLPWWTASPAPTVSLRFAQVATVYDEILIGYNQPANVTFRDSQLHGGLLYNLSGSAVGVTNCLWDRVWFTADFSATPGAALRNNLFRGGILELFPGADTTVRDNLFDQTAIPYLDNVTSSHNGYVAGYDRLQPTQSTDKVLTSITYDSGWLGRYYLPATSTLIDAGSQSAASAGLWHYTTTTNQVMETSSTVDIGLHYATTGANGAPNDSDAEGLVDAIEDKNGNGTKDSGETDMLRPDTDGDGLTDHEEVVRIGSAVT